MGSALGNNQHSVKWTVYNGLYSHFSCVDIFRTDAEISHLNGPAAIKELQVVLFAYQNDNMAFKSSGLFLSRSLTLRREVGAYHWTL